MGDSIADLFIRIGADVGGALDGLRNIGGMIDSTASSLGNFGSMMTSAVTAPIVGGFQAVIGAASANQDVMAQFDNELKNLGATTTMTTATTGHFAEIVNMTGKEHKQLTAHIDSTEAAIAKVNNRLAEHAITGKAASAQLKALQSDLDLYNRELGAGETAHKVWINGQGAVEVASHMTRQALLDMAYGFENTTTASHDSTIAAETMMLRYNKISADEFPKVMQASLDLSAAMGGDLATNAQKLGEIMQNPANASRILRGEGIILTASQERLMKQMGATGDVAGQQKMILDLLSGAYGGSAAAAAGTFSGQLAILGNKFNDLLQTIGDDFLPILTSVTQVAIQVVSGIGNLDPVFVLVTGGALAVAAAIGPIATGLGLLLSPIGLVAGAAVALGAIWSSNFGGIRDTVQGAVDFIRPKLEGLVNAAKGFWDTLFPKQQTPQMPDLAALQIKKPDAPAAEAPFMDRMVKAIGDYGPKILGALTDLFSSAWTGLTGWVTTTGVPLLSGALSSASTWISANGPGMLAALRDFISGAIAGAATWITTKGIPALGDAISGVGTWITNNAGPAIGNALNGLFDLAGTVIPNFLGSVDDLLNQAGGWILTNGPSEISKFITGLFTSVGDNGPSFIAGVTTIISNAGDWLVKTGVPMFAKSVIALFMFSGDTLTAIGAGFSSAFTSLFASGGAGDKALQPIRDAWNNLFGPKGSLQTLLGGIGDWVSKGLSDAFKGVVEIITAPFREVVRQIANMLISIGGLGGMFTPLVDDGNKLLAFAGPKAAGGPVMGGQTYLVGEMGPELFTPGASGNIIPNRDLTAVTSGNSGGGGGGTSISIQSVVMNGVQDMNGLLDELEAEAGRRGMKVQTAR